MTIFRVGDSVIYRPPYPVDGLWLTYKQNKKEFVVVRGTEMANSDGEQHTTIVVTHMRYAGFDRHEIPHGKAYKLNVTAFYHAVPQHPSWEL
jgi:hypothetical protein